ncbi:MAG: hypothetical protein QOG71_3268 [Pyrinomonadaceae bacterium]|nr:hypothetical protein [Pyrinomonadaceae bacterium]
MNYLRPRFAKLNVSARLLFICATFALAASLLGATAYVQNRQAAAAQQQQPPAAPATRIEKLGAHAPEPREGLAEPEAAPREILPSITSNYNNIAATNGSLTDMTTGTTQLVAASQDDFASPVSNIGFDFYFQGTRFTQFSASSNGGMRLGGTAIGSTSYGNAFPFASQSILAPFMGDHRTSSTGKVHFKVIGSAPNRTLIVEWLNMNQNWNSATVDGTYQARLYETTGIIEYVYGSMAINGTSTVGGGQIDVVGFASTTGDGNFLTVNQATNAINTTGAAVTSTYSTTGPIANLTSAANGSRRIYTFTPPSTPTAPTNLTFTAVTPTSMTLNWTDSPNEQAYAIFNSTDGTNFNFVTQPAQNATSQNVTGLSPSTNYVWQVFAVSEGALSSALSGSQATAAPGNIMSTAVGGNWSSTLTWVGGVIPSATDNVTIADAATVTIDTAANAFSLSVGTGLVAPTTLQYETTTARALTVVTNVTIASNGTFRSATTGTQTGHVLSLGGNLTNNGILDFSTTATNVAGASINFTGAANNTFGGTGATTDVRTITINKGTSNASILELNPTNFTVQGVATDGTPAAYLTLTNGTFKISGTFTAAFRTFTTAAYTIGATTGIWLNNPNYTVSGQGSSPANNGLLRISQGTFNVGTGTGNSMGAGAGAVFTIEGGTFNATGRLQTTSAVTYNQSGGTVNVNTISGGSSSNGSFGFSSASSVINMSGGTINLVQASTAATPFDYQFSGTANITGGTLNVGTAATATNFNFRIRGQVPNLVINNTTNNKTATLIAQTNVFGDITVSPGTTLNLNGFLLLDLGTNLFNNGTILGNTTGSRLYFAGAGAQQYGGSGVAGTVALPLLSLDFDSAGVTIQAGTTNNLITNRINMFRGNVTNTYKITLGVGGTSTGVVQFGVAGATSPTGSFDVAPTFNLGSGGEIMLYAQETAVRTTGVEINPTRVLSGMTVDNTNNLIIAGGDLAVTGALAFTNGTITTAANTLISSSSGTITRTNGYVIGNLRQTFTANGTKPYAVGTTNGFSPVSANVTAGTGDLTMRATQGKLPAISGANALARYWTLTGTGMTADLQFFYLAGDVTGTESNYSIIKQSSGVLTLAGGSVNPATHIATINGVSSFSNWTLAEPAAINAGSIQFDSATYNVGESAGTVTLNATRTGGTDGAVGISYATSDGTASSVAGADYLQTTGGTSWASGESGTKTIVVTITPDMIDEPDETFTVALSNPSGGATLGSPATATVTINDDDNPATPAAVVYVDDNFTGANGSDPDGAGPATSIGYDAFATIQGGVSGVAAGGTVNVAAGTYTENVTISEALTLNGAGVSVVTLRPALSGANPCAGASLCPGASNLMLVQASNVTISGLTLDGDNPTLTSGIVRGGADLDARNGIITNHTVGSFNNLEVHHATIKNIYLRGVYNSTGGAFNFHDNTVQNVQGDGGSIGLFNFGGAGAFTNNTVSACNDAIASNHSRGTQFTGNNVTTSASGIHTDNAGDGGGTPDTISGNTVTDSQQFGYGIWTFVPANVVTVSNNTVTNVEVGLASAGGQGGSSTFNGNTVNGMSRANATGVYLTTDQFGFGQGNNSVVFRSNTVTGNVDGFFLEANESGTIASAVARKLPASANLSDGREPDAKAKGTPSVSATSYTLNVNADFNRTTGNSSTGVSKTGSGILVLNFENNWWGCNAGPNQTGCQTVDAAADFSPWLVLTVSASPNPIAPGGSTTVTADLRHNSDGAIPSSTVFVPPTPVAFSATNGTITPSNATTANGDAAATFTSTSASSGTASATIDNQTTSTNVNVNAPAFSIDDVTHDEGNSGTTSYTFTITKTGATNFGASVDYATVDGTATSPSDFTALSTTTLAFTSVETTKQITVFVNGDATVEPDEAFTVHLSNASGATIADADGTGTITNDDARPAPAVVYVDDDFTGASGTDPDGAGPATEIGYDAFPTVQGGVNGVAPNGTVNVASGNYPEQVVIGKSLTLAGAGAATTTISTPASLTPGIGGNLVLVEVNGGATVNASGIAVAGPRVFNGCSAQIFYGVYVSGAATLNLSDSAVRDIRLADPSLLGCQDGIAIRAGSQGLAQTATLSLDTVSVTNYQKSAVIVDGTGTTATITDSTITGQGVPANLAANAIQIGRGAAATVTGNTISGNLCNNGVCGPDPFTQAFSTGVLIFSTSNAVTLSNNTFSNNDVGVYNNAANTTVSGNTFTANRYENLFLDEGNAVVSDNNMSGASNVGVLAVSFVGNAGNSTGTLTRNNITGAGVGLQLLDDTSGADNFTPQLTAHSNRIVATTTAIDNPQSQTVDLENNWWGCNAGPGNTGCGAVTGTGADFNPWFVLAATATPNSIVPGGTSNVAVDMTKNSDGATPAPALPDLPVAYSATNGTMSPTNATVSAGASSSTFTSTNSNSAVATVTVDNQTINLPITVNAPSFSVDDVTHTEGNSGTTSYVFTVTKTGATMLASSVQIDTVDGTATSPSDFTANTATLNFGAADTTMQFTVLVNGDTNIEPNEAFTVHLSNASGAGISDADGTGTITNDDNAPPPVVYVDDDWVGLSNGTDPDGAGPATSIGYDAFATINGGIGGVANPGTVNVYAGTYDEDVNVNKTVSLIGTQGAGVTNVRGPIGGSSATTIQITASNVTVAGFTITRLGNNTTDWNNPGLNSAGIAIQGQAITGALIRDNIITGNRNGLDLNNTNGHTVRNNVIDFNRTGFIYRNQTDNQTVVENFITNNWTVGVLFLDASSGSNVPVQTAAHSVFSNNNISANWYGQIVDRQTGGSLPAPATTNYKNFRHNWFGTTSPIVTTANSAEPGYAAQIPVAYGGTATPPGGQPDIAGPASANFKYQPFLQSGTDTNVETTPGRGTNGFQGQINNIVVTPANQQGWIFFDDAPGTGTGSGGFEQGPATPPLGVGSAFLTVDAQGRHALGTGGYGGTRMDDVTTLAYHSYQDNNANTVVAPSLQFDIDYDLNDAATAYMGRLAFEPYLSPTQGAVAQNVWQNWDGLLGNWYGTRTTVTVNNVSVAQPCQPATPCTWQQVIALFPNAGVRNTPASAVLFKVGGPWSPGFDGNVDNFRIAITTARVTYDFEPLPQLSINDVTHNEGNAGQTDYTFTVTLSPASDQTVTVDYATADGTATAPSDYIAHPTTQLSFAPGDTQKQFTVKVNGDTLFEPDEAFVVNLSNASANATVSDNQGTGTITNDDGMPAISINDVFVAEPDTAGTTNATFTVTLSQASASPVTVTYQTADGTANAPDDYNAVAPTVLTFDPGQTSKNVSVTINADALAEGAETFTVNLSNPSSNATIADSSGTGTITDAVTTGQVLISEFRFRGATYAAGVDGSYDEYVELYNNTNSPIVVGTADGSSGWTIAALSDDGTTIVPLVTIPGGTFIPARGHYLVAYSDTPVNSATGGYSLGGYAVPDRLYTIAQVGDGAGVALFRTAEATNFNAAERLDAAGFSGTAGATADMFREGAGLTSPGANDGQYAFVRKLISGTPQDTNDNAADFGFYSTDGASYGGVQSILGAPGPESADKPVQRNGVIKAALIDGTAFSTAPPNRVRSGQVQPGVPNAYGTLSIQRRFKNTTALPVTRLRFRIVDITTLNSPVASSPQSDLRVLTSTGVVTNSQGQVVVTVNGLTLEQPPAQTNGGGMNSTLTVALPGNMLAPGSTIDVQFLLGVEQQGAFRFLVNVEALPGLANPFAPPDQSNMKSEGTKKSTTPKTR